MTGSIAKVEAFLRVLKDSVNLSDVECDPGGGAVLTCNHFADPGDDSHPLTSDYVALLPTEREGSAVVVGYADPVSTPKAQPGDKRIYSRSEAGETKAEVWLKNSGDIVVENSAASVKVLASGEVAITNSSGSMVLAPSGVITLNGAVTISPSGDIVTTGTLTAAQIVESTTNVDLAAHVHSGVDTGPGNTGPPV